MIIRKIRSGEKARKDLFSSESAAATVIAAVLLLSIIFTLFAVVKIAYVPQWKSDAEELHMKEVFDNMGNLRSAIDTVILFKSSSASSPSTTVQIHMGGGEVPILDTSRSSGVLSVNMDLFSAYITLTDRSGNVIYSEPFDCGGITYSSNNKQFVDQTLRYENGALILAQENRSVMRQCTPFTISSTKIDAENGTYNFSSSINLINVSGAADSVSSDTVESLRVLATDFKQIRYEDSTQVGTFNYTVFTKYPDAWSFYFNETAKNAGLIYGSDFNVIESLSGGSIDLYSVSFNFLHTGDKHLDNLYINRSTIDVGRGSVVKIPTKSITSVR
jgi:hypothetical protein